MGNLYFGDNLEILRDHIQDESIDLVYLDPPFNSKRDYNLLFKSPKGHTSDASITAFEDSWQWGAQAEREFEEILHQSNLNVSEMMRALRKFLGDNDVMAYLVMMCNRLLELHRVLKSTGSLYLHCDPTASHYLKVVLDGVFGKERYRNEIIWKRTSAHSGAKRYGPVHDVILFYSKTAEFAWNPSYQNYDESYLNEFYTHVDPSGRRWRRSDLTGAGKRNGETGEPWRGIDVTSKGRHWACPPSVLEEMDKAGKIHWPARQGGMPMLKRYLDEQPGVPLQDVWTDVNTMHNLSSERLGYPTQKPLALLERIIKASCPPGGTILDPFCGCGTAVHAAEKLGLSWIGIDITHLAISVIEERLRTHFPSIKFATHGTPRDIDAARELSKRNKYEFQYWVCHLLGAQPYQNKKKGADGGIDGILYFKDVGHHHKKIILSVKGGENVNVAMIRDLGHVVTREKAEIGLFVTLTDPTRPMREEAVKAGFYAPPFVGKKFAKLQILTVEGLLKGTEYPEYPSIERGGVTIKKQKGQAAKQMSFLLPYDGKGGAQTENSPSSINDAPTQQKRRANQRGEIRG